jgi:hypothetical protein
MLDMRVKRTATIVLGGGALAAWFAGAATSNRPLPDPIVSRTPSIDARGADLAEEIARLRERLRPTAAPHTPGRNLFRFRAAPIAPLAVVAAPQSPIVEAPPAAPAPPALRLSGIGEDAGADGPLRIAFIAGDGQLYMVKEGELVTPRYRVTKIAGDAVELIDVNDQTVRRLALR